ncbi:MAG TPA: M23 family metallopeptidase [Acidimicrobiales bacterium]|nr:M23 family metallopeptidase [Acidimicrobiales bacterium]
MRARHHRSLLCTTLAVALTVALAPPVLASPAQTLPASERAPDGERAADVGRPSTTGLTIAGLMGWRNPRPVTVAPAATAPVAPVAVGLRLHWPMLGEVTSGFGMRWGRPHQGLDIPTPWHTLLVAPAAGTVTYAGWRSGYGITLEIQHAEDTMTRYAHLAGTPVQVGDAVSRGDWIANTGNTGQSTGPHLHFEVHIGGAPVDPLPLLPLLPPGAFRP